MILLLGGTSETDPIARALAGRGICVLVSTATDHPLTLAKHPNIRRVCGTLTEQEANRLVQESEIQAIVDATHPYATEVSRVARSVATRQQLPCFRYDRPPAVQLHEAVLLADNHEQAARMAFSFGERVLLTVGSKNLAPYLQQARARGLPVMARILDREASLRACRSAGLPAECLLAGQGPFSLEQNREAIRRFGIGVLVTKDSGMPGGVPQKLQAARAENCRVVVVRRPSMNGSHTYRDVEELISAVCTVLGCAIR